MINKGLLLKIGIASFISSDFLFKTTLFVCSLDENGFNQADYYLFLFYPLISVFTFVLMATIPMAFCLGIVATIFIHYFGKKNNNAKEAIIVATLGTFCAEILLIKALGMKIPFVPYLVLGTIMNVIFIISIGLIFKLIHFPTTNNADKKQ